MFMVKLTYLRPVEEVDRALQEHRAHLRAHFDSGHFIVSGREIPRIGGIIIARAESRAEIDAIVRSDPFVRQDLASYEVVEFEAAMTCDALTGYRAK